MEANKGWKDYEKREKEGTMRRVKAERDEEERECEGGKIS